MKKIGNISTGSVALLAALAVGAGTVGAPKAQADIFALKSGGEIRGELVNADETSSKRYTIQPYSGGEITIERGLVARVIDQKPLIEEYETRKWQQPDTAEGHWEMAAWCRANRLKAEQKVHLLRVLELDGEHRKARRSLRYSLVDGVWRTYDEIELAKGKIKVNGAWRFPEDIELEERRDEAAKKRRAWFKTIGRWDSWFGSERGEQAKANILEIKDPVAVDALQSRLKDVKRLKIRKVYAKALASIGTKDAINTIVRSSIEDKDREFRAHCFDMIETYQPPLALDMYLKMLKSRRSTNVEINRAAIGLKYLGDKTAVPVLIDKLITVHRVKKGNGVTGSTSASFGQGGSSKGAGFGTGQPTTRKKSFKNEYVLGALARLTGEDFGFSLKSWQTWYAKYKNDHKGPRVNPRRD